MQPDKIRAWLHTASWLTNMLLSSADANPTEKETKKIRMVATTRRTGEDNEGKEVRL